MPKRFFDTKAGAEVKVVDPKDFIFVEAPGGVRIVPKDSLEEIKGDIRCRQKSTGIEYEGHNLEKSGPVLQFGFGRMVPVKPDQHEYVKGGPAPEVAPVEPPKAP